MTNISEVINLAFREITEKGLFDKIKGNEPIKKANDKPMSEVPGIMTEYVNDCGYGCCFVFSRRSSRWDTDASPSAADVRKPGSPPGNGPSIR